MQNTDDPPGHLNINDEILDVKWKLIRYHTRIVSRWIIHYETPSGLPPVPLRVLVSQAWLEDYFKI